MHRQYKFNVQQVRDSRYLDYKLVRVDVKADALPSAKGQFYIVVLKGLLDDKKESYSFEPGERQRSDGATFSGNGVVTYVVS